MLRSDASPFHPQTESACLHMDIWASQSVSQDWCVVLNKSSIFQLTNTTGISTGIPAQASVTPLNSPAQTITYPLTTRKSLRLRLRNPSHTLPNTALFTTGPIVIHAPVSNPNHHHPPPPLAQSPRLTATACPQIPRLSYSYPPPSTTNPPLTYTIEPQ
jgi:hypothetical protein